MIDIVCQCGTQLRLGPEWAGKKGRCPRCGSVVAIQVPKVPKSTSTPNSPRPTQAATGDALPKLTPRFTLRQKAGIAIALASVSVSAIGAVIMYVRRESRPIDDSSLSSLSLKQNQNANENIGGSSDSNTATSPVSPNAEGNSASMEEESDSSKPPTSSDQVRAANPTPTSRQTNQTKERASGVGLTGISTKYDDFHCTRIQRQYGIRIPPEAELLQVDGRTIQIDNLSTILESKSPYLILPRGKHIVRFRSECKGTQIEMDDEFETVFRDMQRFFRTGDTIDLDALLGRSARAFDVHNSPFLVELIGRRLAADGQWTAAERYFRRALCINPTYSLAHANLARCLIATNSRRRAELEVQLAEAFNVGNVYGLSAELEQLRDQLGIRTNSIKGPELPLDSYLTKELVTVEDERLVGLLRALAKYTTQASEQGKVLNNLALHFADSHRAEWSLEYYREAMAALKTAGPERFEIARTVFENMEMACRDADFVEAEHYRQMRELIQP